MIGRVELSSLEFARIPMSFLSTCGVPQKEWVRVGMPRIPQNVINSVFFLYKSEDDAKAGRNPEGSGFIVAYSEPEGRQIRHTYYGVTNWHVACGGGASVVRLNTTDGGTDVLDFNPDQWEFIPGKYDVAVVELSIDQSRHDVSAIPITLFVENIISERHEHQLFGVGDDVFMLGLFLDHDGIVKNVPSARFGNISMMPSQQATIKQDTGYDGISYIVDMRSRSGFSGSPVFAYRTFGNDLTNRGFGEDFDSIDVDGELNLEPSRTGAMAPFREELRSVRLTGSRGRLKTTALLKLLGIHWGQFPEEWELKHPESMGKNEKRRHLITDGAYVAGLSGMTCVIPAWQILEVLNVRELGDRRTAALAAARNAPISESSSPANPSHREDFTSLLNAAAKKKIRDDQTSSDENGENSGDN